MHQPSAFDVTLGTDPEVFVVNNGTPIPGFYALGMGGVKEISLPHGELTSDGCAVEFTQTPRSDPLQLVSDISENLKYVQAIAKSSAVDLLGRKIHVSLFDSPTVEVPWEYIRALSSTNLQEVYGLSKELTSKYALDLFGCSPDFSVYTETTMCRPDPRETRLRTSGGHIHFGLGKYVYNTELIQYITAALDMTLGCLSVHVLSNVPEAKLRTQLYGEPGNIRLNYSRETLEYRVLPAIMLLHDPALAGLCFSLGKSVVESVVSLWEDGGEEAVAECITEDDALDYMMRAMKDYDPYSASAVLDTILIRLFNAGYGLSREILRSHGWRCDSVSARRARAGLVGSSNPYARHIGSMPVYKFEEEVTPGDFMVKWQ